LKPFRMVAFVEAVEVDHVTSPARATKSLDAWF
jgi:hypothetical protein